MKKMFLYIPDATEADLESMRGYLQEFFKSHCKEDYLVLVSKKQFEKIAVDTEVFDKLK